MTLPALFIAHGAPSLALEDNEYTRFIKSVGTQLLPKPQAVVVFSAHWDTPEQCIGNDEIHETMHDYYGFPDKMYEIEYRAPGSQLISQKIADLFKEHNLPYNLVASRGLDHGAWVVARMLYPDADVPIVALSVDSIRTPKEQYEIGKMLSELRREDVLIIGSGGLVHNLRQLGDGPTAAWATEFDDWIGDKLERWDLDMLFQYEKRAPYARDAVPSYGTEHFAPLLYAMGSADDERVATKLFQIYQYQSLSLNCWMFGHQP